MFLRCLYQTTRFFNVVLTLLLWFDFACTLFAVILAPLFWVDTSHARFFPAVLNAPPLDLTGAGRMRGFLAYTPDSRQCSCFAQPGGDVWHESTAAGKVVSNKIPL